MELIPVKVKKYYQLPNPTKLNNLQVLKKKINASGESNLPTFSGTGRCMLTISTNWPRMRSCGSDRGGKGMY